MESTKEMSRVTFTGGAQEPEKMIAIIFSQHSICCAVRKQQRVCDLPSCFLTVQQMLICLLTVEQMLIFLGK